MKVGGGLKGLMEGGNERSEKHSHRMEMIQ